VPRTCDGTGHWQAGTPCGFACSAGGCAGSCKPGSHRCTPNQMAVETCGNDASTWSQTGTCDVGCDTATGACKTCGGSVPDKCNGTCTNLQNDTKNCGACGHDCTALAHIASTASVSCQSGHCVIPASACSAGYGHCGSAPADNGCETNIAAPATCGCGSACGARQMCSQNGASYECRCASVTPDTCGGECVDKKSDAGNCGTCGHSCLGGVCSDGTCKAVQIYKGADFLPNTFALDANYIYFKRQKPGDISVLARMPKAGGEVLDLTSVDEGSSRVAVAGGKIYWGRGAAVEACTAPSCSGRFYIPSQN
jgi:hypothetical protein